jgi:hypothetical protein
MLKRNLTLTAIKIKFFLLLKNYTNVILKINNLIAFDVK